MTMKPVAAVLASLLVAGSAIVGIGTANASVSYWYSQSTPNPVVHRGDLVAVSCVASGKCVSVGSSVGAYGSTPLAESWNGTGWSLTSNQPESPAGDQNTQLSGVSCVSTTFCIAVGTAGSTSNAPQGSTVKTGALAERWDGSVWQVLPTPAVSAPQSYLSAVSCTSTTACIAVGYKVRQSASTHNDETSMLAMRWNGDTWKATATVDPSGGTSSDLDAVSCSSADACTAVGDVSTDTAFVERWNGTKWRYGALRSPAGTTFVRLAAVSCTSSKACAAIGAYSYRINNVGRTGFLDERWNGTYWKVRTLPNPQGTRFLSGLSCSSPTACKAVGSDQLSGGTSGPAAGTLSERWNGSSWAVQTTPNPSGVDGSSLSAVSCTATACIAVGSTTTGANTVKTLAERWNGSEWTVLTTPNPAGNGVHSELLGVSCPTTKMCMAVGHDSISGTPVIERWNGKTWALAGFRLPFGTQHSTLTAVSCSSPARCVAVGSYTDGTGSETLAQLWNGHRWTLSLPPNPKGHTFGLAGVSCLSATFCMAAGSGFVFQDHRWDDNALAERWNGSKWTIVNTKPADTLFYTGTFVSISCSSRQACMAVGETYDTDVQQFETFAERWNGTRWVELVTADAPSDYTTESWAVSCSAANACMSVGIYYSRNYKTWDPEAQRWNGRVWKNITFPITTGQPITGGLSGVACTSATSCVAVGGRNVSSGPLRTEAQHWNGTGWRMESTENPTNRNDSDLSTVSCASASACTAVGDRDNDTRTLAERRSAH